MRRPMRSSSQHSVYQLRFSSACWLIAQLDAFGASFALDFLGSRDPGSFGLSQRRAKRQASSAVAPVDAAGRWLMWQR